MCYTCNWKGGINLQMCIKHQAWGGGGGQGGQRDPILINFKWCSRFYSYYSKLLKNLWIEQCWKYCCFHQVVSQMNSVETSWTMGAALDALSSLQSEEWCPNKLKDSNAATRALWDILQVQLSVAILITKVLDPFLFLNHLLILWREDLKIFVFIHIYCSSLSM